MSRAKNKTTVSFDQLASSPLQRLHSPFLEQAAVQLFIKRDDLIHPQFGGNKWRKLKYNLIHARENNFDTLLTFGGAWSNHIYACAAAGKHFGFNTIGIIRGEKHIPLNSTLSFAEKCGMQLHYCNRVDYRKKNETEYLEKLKQQFGHVYILPEGGSNALAMKGCAEIIYEIAQDNMSTNDPGFDVICCASGTGATLAGLISAIKPTAAKGQAIAIGFSALKSGDFLKNEVNNFLGSTKTTVDWRIETNFHFGGYAKVSDDLIHFMKDFHTEYGFPLDAVYTGKMFYGLFKMIEHNHFKPGTKIIAIHSGGLQGNAGFDL